MKVEHRQVPPWQTSDGTGEEEETKREFEEHNRELVELHRRTQVETYGSERERRVRKVIKDAHRKAGSVPDMIRSSAKELGRHKEMVREETEKLRSLGKVTRSGSERVKGAGELCEEIIKGQVAEEEEERRSENETKVELKIVQEEGWQITREERTRRKIDIIRKLSQEVEHLVISVIAYDGVVSNQEYWRTVRQAQHEMDISNTERDAKATYVTITMDEIVGKGLMHPSE